jgi:ABC-type lipoprotein release transport system permease subunit
LQIPESYGSCDTLFDITDADINEFWNSSAGKYFKNAIEVMRTANNSFNISVAYDIEAVSSLHTGDDILEAGSIPADRAVPSCLFPVRLATPLHIKPGDNVTVNIHKPTVGKGAYVSYFPQEGFAASETFTVSGLYRSERFDAPVYILDCGQAWIAASDTDYTLARVVIKNREAASYTEYVSGRLPAGVAFEPFDQGYEAATRAIFNMRETAILITVVTGAVGIVVLWFFAFLFVYRAAESVRIVLRLGAGAGKALIFLLTGSTVITLIAACLGTAVGYLISNVVVSAVYASAGANDIYDLRFSILSRGAQLGSFKPTPQISADIYFAVFAVIVIAAMLLCLVFGVITVHNQNAFARFKKAQRRNTARKGIKFKKAFGSYDFIPFMSLRYAIRSIIRGRLRSLVVPVLFTAMLLFVFLFNQVREGYSREMDSVYKDIPVSLWFTNSNALQRNLSIKGESFEELDASGYVQDKWQAVDYRYINLGLARYADGTYPEIFPVDVKMPTAHIDDRGFRGQMLPLTSPLIVTNQVSKTQGLNAASENAIRWADGYTLEDFIFSERTPRSSEPVPVLLSQGLCNNNGYQLRDVISITMFYMNPVDSRWYRNIYSAVIVGIYEAKVEQSTMYMPMAMDITNGIYNQIQKNADNGQNPNSVTDYGIYNKGGYTVSEPSQLTAFKDWLEPRYDPVGKAGWHRRWLIIDDKALYNTVESLTRYINYMDMLFPVMMAAVAAIGFIASSLLLKSRSGEISAMRSLGAKAGQVFASFFIEPVILSLPGIALGIAVAVSQLNVTAQSALIYALLLATCYYAGAAVATVHTYRKAVIVGLHAEE